MATETPEVTITEGEDGSTVRVNMNPGHNTTIAEKQNSCEISVNGKGEVAFKVKAYGTTLAKAANEAYAEYERVRAILAQAEKAALTAALKDSIAKEGKSGKKRQGK